MMLDRRIRTGFTLIELLVVIAIIALLVSILLPALAKARRAARLTVCQSNLHQSGVASASYAADYKGTIPSFSWKPGIAYSNYKDLNENPGNVQYVAHANQAVDIIRRHRNESQPSVQSDRLMNRNFTYLMLVDGGYIASRLPEPSVVCPEDDITLIWQKYADVPGDAVKATGRPDPNAAVYFDNALPFWSTYQVSPYAWSPDTEGNPISQFKEDYRLYNYNYELTDLVQRKMEEVAFPSQKVVLFDLFDRHHYQRTIFYAYSVASQPLLALDASVTTRRTEDCNKGWDPWTPRSPKPLYDYRPSSPLDPPTLSGGAVDKLNTYYRWTRNGLRGVDFGGITRTIPR